MPYPMAAVRGRSSGSALTYASFLAPYVANSTLPLWLKFRETSDTTAVNSGSAGATLDGTIAGTTALGQTGKLGANEAYDFDGLTSIVSLAASALLDLPAFTVAALVKPDNAGESNLGALWRYNATRAEFNTALTSIRCVIDAATDADTITTTGLTAGQWVWLIATYNHATDGLVRLYKGLAGTVTEFAYSTHIAGSGTRVSHAAIALNVGNASGQNRTFDGLYDEFQMHTVVRDTTWMTQLTQLSGV